MTSTDTNRSSAAGAPRRPEARRPDLDSLYCINEDGSRNTIHTADVRGRFQRRKKLIWTLLIAIYVVLPWIEIGGHPAILIDIPHSNFYLFGQTFNAQDFYLFYFVLTGIGFTLIFLSSLFGRVWCGYACPQTVFLDGVYRRIERWIEGGAPQRKKLQEMPWNVTKLRKRVSKWALFLLLSLLLSHSFLAYFMPVDVVLSAITGSPSAHPVAFTFIVIFTAIIYVNFTWFREQLCIVVCPYGRLQGVLYDRETINVAYDQKRGEPRGRYTKGERGDCIDCFRCVAVCPTGIDIRNGTQLECIGCANCIDACDEVMDKLGQPRGLIRYDSQAGLETGRRRIVRPRLFFYAALLLIGLVVMLVAAANRTPFEANMLRQRGAAAYELREGGARLRNFYELHLVNKQPDDHVFVLSPIEPDGVKFGGLLPQVAVRSLEDIKLPFFVDVERSRWQQGMNVELRVHTADGTLERVVATPVLGPR
ncbi:MAG: cytochrome c oxidase accessory protein CcoG [Planctomycetes bacterium]|nr:cytochrome c oxidase accessory protein CcoG [Planctomycetota bacterium]